MIPIIIISVAVALAGGTIVVIAHTKPQKVKGTSMGVLGELKSGKTSFLFRLGLVSHDGSDDEGGRTTEDDYINPAVINTASGDIKILPGKDIGGARKWQEKYLSKFCHDCDIVFYIFNGEDFIVSTDYRKQVNIVLKVIYDRFIMEEKDLGNVVIIASRADEFEKRTGSDRKEMGSIIRDKVLGKNKRTILDTNFYCINCKEKEEVMKVAETLFERGLFK